MFSLPCVSRINRYFLASGLLTLALLIHAADSSAFHRPVVAAWLLAALSSHALLYLLPAWLITQGTRLLWARSRMPRGTLVVGLVAVVSVTLIQTLLYADQLIHKLYGFHINGFVIDLVLTPGGIDSLGANPSTQAMAVAIVLLLAAAQAGLYFLSRPRSILGRWLARLRMSWLLAVLLTCGLGERLAYAYSSAAGFPPILFASKSLPLYQPLTMRKVAKALGIDSRPAPGVQIRRPAVALSYPRKPLRIEPPAQPPNIVWLVAESLRFDMLDPAIMPRLWAFSTDALRLEKHFSGGNLTQMGVFSMFYGLYGSDWFPMRAAERAPLLMDVLQQERYQFALYTSQRFTYPAFDKTIFVNMRPEDLHPFDSGPPAWQRDVENIDAMLRFIDGRDRTRPFMSYMFFESTHAPYDFPQEAAFARPYLENFNYLSADFGREIGLIKNRYLNASRHIDGQIGRVIDHLRKEKLLENTIVIVLGDHGEEFMERGRWGHSAEFNRFQTGTPAVIRVPGQAPRVITGISSHLDLPATLMPLLGVKNPPEDYSNGFNLLAADFHRDYAVAADWNRIAYLGNDFKVSFPVNALGAIRNEVTDGEDRPVKDGATVIRAIRASLQEIMSHLARFTRPASESSMVGLPHTRAG